MCCLKINTRETHLFLECFESLLTEHTFSCSLCAYVLFAHLSFLSRTQEAMDKSAESGTRCSPSFSNLLKALQVIRLLSSPSDAKEVDAETFCCTIAIPTD